MKILTLKFGALNLSLLIIVSLFVSIPVQVAIAPKAQSAVASICSGN